MVKYQRSHRLPSVTGRLVGYGAGIGCYRLGFLAPGRPYYDELYRQFVYGTRYSLLATLLATRYSL